MHPPTEGYCLYQCSCNYLLCCPIECTQSKWLLPSFVHAIQTYWSLRKTDCSFVLCSCNVISPFLFGQYLSVCQTLLSQCCVAWNVVVPIMLLLLLSVCLCKDNCDCHPMVERTHILCRLLYATLQHNSARTDNRHSWRESRRRIHAHIKEPKERKKPIEARILRTISSVSVMVSPPQQPSATIGPDILRRRECRHSVRLASFRNNVLRQLVLTVPARTCLHFHSLHTFTSSGWTRASGKCPQVWHHHHHHQQEHSSCTVWRCWITAWAAVRGEALLACTLALLPEGVSMCLCECVVASDGAVKGTHSPVRVTD